MTNILLVCRESETKARQLSRRKCYYAAVAALHQISTVTFGSSIREQETFFKRLFVMSCSKPQKVSCKHYAVCPLLHVWPHDWTTTTDAQERGEATAGFLRRPVNFLAREGRVRGHLHGPDLCIFQYVAHLSCNPVLARCKGINANLKPTRKGCLRQPSRKGSLLFPDTRTTF